MKYIQLKKMFHIDENKCNELYFKRFNSETTNHLEIKLNNDYECFYLINDEILSLLDKIYMLNTWLEKTMASDALPNLAKEYLIISTLVEEIRSSNQMEGIYSTRKELKDMLIDNTPKNYKRFSGMINKYEKLRKEQFLKLNSVSDIRTLYDEILLEDVINEDEKDKPDGVIFRKGSVEISSGTKVIHQGIVGENNIIDMIEKSLKILNNENINFLIRIAVFHYLFEYIHPFYNGNGRMGRFLASGYLANHLNILCALQFSIACTHNNKKYYEAFTLTNDIRNKSDLTVFIIYFLEIYLSGLQELKEKIEDTINVYNYMVKKLCKYVDSKYQSLVELILQVTLFGIEGVTITQLVKITNYSEQSIRTMIKKINHKNNIIKIDQQHKPYKYSINLDVVSKLKES